MKKNRLRIFSVSVACLLLLTGCSLSPAGEGQNSSVAAPDVNMSSGPEGSVPETGGAPDSAMKSPETSERSPSAETVSGDAMTTEAYSAGDTGTDETAKNETTAPEVTSAETTAAEITTAAVTTVPETTVPETTVPETTVPETTVPETTVPETTVPETTVPETTVPETTVPETTVPETTVPETTVPETTVPGTVSVQDPPDTTAPFFLNLKRSVTLKVGSTFDIHKYISYVDDLDPDVILDVTGTVDTGKVGVYNLSFSISDHSGNSLSSTMKVEIVETIPSSGSSSSSTTKTKSFQTFLETYKTENTMVGIDVSRYQGKVDFEKVAAAGCEFVIIKIGGYVGGNFTDACYVENLKNAKAAGLKIGIYWYSTENGADAVREHASYLYDLLDGEHLDLPIFFDWENYINFENYKMSLRDYNDMVVAFKEEAKAHGYRGALYASKNKLLTVFDDRVKEGGVWLAHYTSQTTYTGEYFLWQQGQARIDGINGDVDVNVFYPDRLSMD